MARDLDPVLADFDRLSAPLADAARTGARVRGVNWEGLRLVLLEMAARAEDVVALIRSVRPDLDEAEQKAIKHILHVMFGLLASRGRQANTMREQLKTPESRAGIVALREAIARASGRSS